jgi:hypothetical protein
MATSSEDDIPEDSPSATDTRLPLPKSRCAGWWKDPARSHDLASALGRDRRGPTLPALCFATGSVHSVPGTCLRPRTMIRPRPSAATSLFIPGARVIGQGE